MNQSNGSHTSGSFGLIQHSQRNGTKKLKNTINNLFHCHHDIQDDNE